jgi:ABC-type dipeptide/oligopeptide/nickel transport system permease component
MLTRGTAIYVAQRLLLIAFTVLAVSFAAFAMVHSLPGNAFVSEKLHGAALQAVLHQYGLDLPIPIQYWNWLKGAVHGDFGISFVIQNQPITPIVIRELSVSVMLGGAALLITLGMGTLFGVLAAARQNTWVDYALTTFAVIGYSVPSFVLASVFILVFGVWMFNVTHGAFYYPLNWTGTYGTIEELSIPAFAIGLYTSGQVTRITRAAMLDVIQQDYIRTARAKGVRQRVVVLRHAFRNALIPVVSIAGPLVITILVGVVVIENIFGIPGMGKEFVSSILRHDYNIAVAVFTMFAALIGVSNLVVDLAYAAIDPRIRY